MLINEPDAATGYTLFSTMGSGDIFLIDPLGRVAHIWHIPGGTTGGYIKLLDNGNLLVIVEREAIAEFDPRGNIVWQYNAGRHLHHDFLKMPNGNVLLLVQAGKSREEAIAAGANPEFVHERGLKYDYLMEARPTGASGAEIVWEWSPWDHLIQDFDPTKPSYGAIAEHPELIDINFLLETISKNPPGNPRDWLHANAIDYNPDLDQIMLSPRHFSELWIIDRSATMEEARGHSGGNAGMGGDLLYRWGNPRAYARGTLADQRLFWQHHTHWIPPGLPGAGNILVFNNGNEFPGYRRYYSSIDEIAPPVDGYRYRRPDNAAYPPAEPGWTYAAENPARFYAPVASGTQRLPNGNTLIVNWALGTISQATRDGKIAWKYFAPFGRHAHLRQGEHPPVGRIIFPTPYGEVPSLANAIYRAYWYPPDHPGLRALDLTPGEYIEDLPDIYDKAYAAALAGDFGERIADSDFDIYLDADGDEGGRRLIYIKQPCADDDTQPRFFLHITPSDTRDIHATAQERGFDTINFRLGDSGKASDGRCVALRGLPGYPTERIRTGQFTDAGALWQANIDLNE